ncbi:nitrous oxide reductase accessory protein NosL [Paenibacillus sp. ACRRX]|uniref:nitrous oxide reductase accessory protein NosL n=1 Tax=Paenibacillus sp. ACRRX TaxID=2918206 RepID=UPI001EF5D06D|nr:nitrous oxide reductase accessory protein NosL [Paenibacillus sp. ACRRX]MCG7407019.1 nitrous oxide reductase accessory protein NosL [Paenibacillus sp. ACRRX]
MKKITGLIANMFVLMVLLTACGGDKYEPQAINEQTDLCAICKMAVKDDQFATQIITKDGQSLKFDDLGCLNKWKKENGTDTIGAAFVRDHNSKQWIRYEKAYYAYDISYKTPMAYGIVSFEKEADTKAFIEAQGKGKLMTADDLTNHSWEVNRKMMEGMGGHGHSNSEGGHTKSDDKTTTDKNHSTDTNKQQSSGGHGA